MLANMVALAVILTPFALRRQAGPWHSGLGAALLLATGDACIYRAWSLGPTALVTPLAGLYPLVTLALAMAGGEAIGRAQALAIATSLVAVLLVALGH